MKNYHTHTTRCHHAMNTEEQYIIEAIKAGYTELGFSDHTPWHYQSGYIPTMRMKDYELEQYIQTLRKLKEKYKNQISIKIGLEVEYFEEKLPWLKEQIKKYDIDYCILGHHFYKSDETGIYYGNPVTKEQLVEYVDDSLKGMDTGLFSYFAHPDLPNYPESDPFFKEQMRRICIHAKKIDMPLEFNVLGFQEKRHYPTDTFFNLVKEYQNDVIIGIDAHSAKSLNNKEEYHHVKEKLEKKGINVIDTIKFL